MKLSVNEAKLSGLRDRNCATSQQVWSLKYGCLRVRKVTGPFEKRALGVMLIKCTKQIRKTAHLAVNSIATYCTFRLMYRSFKTRLKRLIESVLFNLPCTQFSVESNKIIRALACEQIMCIQHYDIDHKAPIDYCSISSSSNSPGTACD